MSTRDWPAKYWESGTSDIWETTYHAGLPEIDKLSLSDNDVDIRLWSVGGVNAARCTILRRRGGQWTRHEIAACRDDDPEIDYGLPMGAELYRELEEAGLFTMDEPDVESSIDLAWTEPAYAALQVNKGGRVRSFRYDNGPMQGPVADIHRILKKHRLA